MLVQKQTKQKFKGERRIFLHENIHHLFVVDYTHTCAQRERERGDDDDDDNDAYYYYYDFR